MHTCITSQYKSIEAKKFSLDVMTIKTLHSSIRYKIKCASNVHVLTFAETIFMSLARNVPRKSFVDVKKKQIVSFYIYLTYMCILL